MTCNCDFCYHLRFGDKPHTCTPKKVLRMWTRHEIWQDTLVVFYKMVCSSEECKKDLGNGVEILLEKDYMRGVL